MAPAASAPAPATSAARNIASVAAPSIAPGTSTAARPASLKTWTHKHLDAQTAPPARLEGVALDPEPQRPVATGEHEGVVVQSGEPRGHGAR